MRSLTLARLERWLWYVFLVVLPWQTRVILWQADHVFSEWRSASLWFTDVILLALIIIACVRARGWFVRELAADDWLLSLVFSAVVLSLAHALSLGTGIAGVIRFAWGILYYLYLRHWALKTFDPDSSAVFFVVGALAQAALGVAQSIYQQDMGLRWFGETLLRTDMHGVAVFYDLAHDKILRAYGTLPHPNVLAAYLVTAGFALGWLYIRHAQDRGRLRVIWVLAGALLLWGMYATYSRTIIAIGLAAVFAIAAVTFWPRFSHDWPNILLVRYRFRQIVFLVIAVSALFFAVNYPLIRARMMIAASDEAVTLRVEYARDALGSGGGGLVHLNWIGVGIGNFSTWLAWHDPKLPTYLQQPAHNIFLLAYAEIGIIGVGLWLWWLASILKVRWHELASQPFLRLGFFVVLVSFFAIGFFDHFFLTLQQGQLLWWLALAL